MELKSGVGVVVVVLLVAVAAELGGSDLSKDRQECADELVGLAPCLPYVSAEAKTPTIDCCTGLKQVIDKSKKCLCLLIKYRNDPDLGFTLNASLAVNLPSACHSPANISHCIDLLHLPPNSSEAKVYKGFDTASHSNTSSPTSAPLATAPPGKGSSSSSPSTTTTANEKSGAVWTKRRLVAQLLCAAPIVPLVFAVLV